VKQSPGPLRVIHAVVFLGFASTAIAGTHQELVQLWRGLTQRYTGGTPPAALCCAGALLAGMMALVLVVRFALGRAVPLWVSVLLLLGFTASLSVFKREAKGRTVPGANVKALEAAVALHQKLNDPLQKNGKVPALGLVSVEGDTPFYRRPFEALSWHVESVKRTGALPDAAEPGWLLCQVSDDDVSFVITAVGIDADGEPSLLRQEGKPIEYRGAYNPDTTE
jgi:hypothetical protein